MELWTEKYRPKTLEDYVWRDPKQREQVEAWLKEGSLPTIMLTGSPGTGKTSLAYLLMHLLNVNPGDVLDINASRERNIEVVQTKILNFCQTWAMGDMKYIILDEADSMSPLAQRMLRGEIERYSASVRFIFTANYPNKIIPALHSRCQGFHFEALDRDQYMMRAVDVLVNEGVSIETEEDIDKVNKFVDLAYPDMRKCLNLLQQNVVDGKLTMPQESDSGTKEWMYEVLGLLIGKRTKEARTLIVGSVTQEEFDDAYKFLYQNLDKFLETPEKQDEGLLIIRKALVNHALVADGEINLAACMVELGNLVGS